MKRPAFVSAARGFVSAAMRACQPSAYPERKRKCWLRRYLDNLFLRFRDHAVCLEYNGLGLDLKGSRIPDVVTDGFRMNHMLPETEGAALRYDLLLEDKFLFWLFMSHHGVPVVPVFAHVSGGVCWLGERVVSGGELAGALAARGAYFCKVVNGICGIGTRKLSGVDFLSGAGEEGRRWLSSDLIFEDVVRNHPVLRAFNPSTLNTVRIATCWAGGKAELWGGAMLRIGRAGSDVDNFWAGGGGVAISEEGLLGEEMISHDKHYVYTRTTRHPDSGLAFKGVAVPFYRESVDLVKRAQRLFPTIPSIGWDVAITESGPLLLEGNHDWDIVMMELVRREGHMKRYREVYGAWRAKPGPPGCATSLKEPAR